MHPDTRKVAAHMKEFGLNILGRAICEATFSEYTRPFAHALTITHASHAAEVLIKARIAEEHPLLIFSKLPTFSSTDGLLSIKELFGYSKSYTYEDIPNLLWATTGLRIEKLEEYREFGKLRNTIMHFAVPAVELADETLKFAINVMEPLIDQFWGESAIPYAENWDDAIISDSYLRERLDGLGINLTPRIISLVVKE